MPTINIDQLNDKFGLSHGQHILNIQPGKGDIPIVVIQNAAASAVISLQGAHLLSWIPAGEEEVIWLSDEATFAVGKSVRGGIPVCWPWFGAHDKQADYPAHGFARTVLWQLTNTVALSDEATQITFQLDTRSLDDKLKSMWSQATVAEYRVTIGSTLILELNTTNNSEQDINISQALHTYFSVADVSKTSVYGLEGKDFLDKTEGFIRKTQVGPVTIKSEVDRIYLNTADENIIDDQQRKIVIKKQGSHSTVVWNPWQAVAEKMGDLGKDGYQRMLCVETANAADDSITIPPGGQHGLKAIYRLEK